MVPLWANDSALGVGYVSFEGMAHIYPETIRNFRTWQIWGIGRTKITQPVQLFAAHQLPVHIPGSFLHKSEMDFLLDGIHLANDTQIRHSRKGCRNPGWKRYQYRNEAAENEVQAQQASWDELLEQSDFVSVHTDLNETTQGMFNAEAFRKMKNTAVFINSARGPIHVQQDLNDALASGEIFAAGLDVTDPEPIPLDDPLLQRPNCIIAPHIASGTVSRALKTFASRS